MTAVGILGTGRMGSAMAVAVSNAGLPLHLYNRSPGPAAALAERLGAKAWPTPAALAANVDIAISMVANGEAVEALHAGPDGIPAGIRAGAVVVDMSTVLPSTIRSVAPAVQARGAGILDAPVSGSTSLAEAGKLTIMVGGSEEDLERARPALDAIGARLFHLGPLGTGAAMKLAVNTIVFALNGGLAEGLVLAERAGIERSLAYEVFASSAIAAPYVGYKTAHFVEPDSTPAAFSLDLEEKDLTLITVLAADVGAAIPQASVNLAIARAAAATEGRERDMATVAGHLRGLAVAGARAGPIDR
ncbi:MAG: NAD(P)-dependent oxidoreductase [Candidatus Limnocylindrales bacterium]